MKTLILASILALCPFPTPEEGISDVTAICNRVADWQMEHHDLATHNDMHWTNGCLFRGMLEWGLATSNKGLTDYVLKLCTKEKFALLDRPYHADDIAVGMAYIQLYRLFHDPAMIQPLKERAFWVASHPSDVTMSRRHDRWKERWTWCDALYMGAPVYTALSVITGEQVYMDYMLHEFKACTDSLYDRDEHLYYRDCRRIPLREPNGRKQFWSRGNGWAVGALVQVLQSLPDGHPERPYFENLFIEMCNALLALQDRNGIWHSSLLDPDTFPGPETSGSTLFVYSFAWGVNHGYLPDSIFGGAISRGWKALCGCVHEDGMLGYVQKIGSAPGPAGYEDTQVYGAGSFLLAGTEVLKYLSER